MATLTNASNVRAPVGATGEQPALVPVRHGDRTIGAYVARRGTVVFVPAVDLTLVALGGLTCAAVAAVAMAATSGRRPPAIGAVSMGPGGWISLRNSSAPPLRPARGRPWWARLLRAHRLVVEHH